MYNVNGDFGEVRIASMAVPKNSSGLFMLGNVGWHRCNDLYHIERPNGSRQHLIMVTVNGCGSMRVEGKEYKLVPGSIAFIPRNTECEYRTPDGGEWEFYWLHPRGSFAELFLDGIVEKCASLCQKSAYDYRDIMEDIIALCFDRTADGHIRISQKISEVLHYTALTLLESSYEPSAAERATRYINEHFSENITNRTVARQVFVSENHLIRVFKKELGCTPHRYLINYRIMMAKVLLRSCNMSIEEIARRVGFYSSSQFIMCFKKVCGCTPNKYRENRA